MPRTKREPENPTADLLRKLLILQMHSLGAAQDRIAKAVGRQKAWVNGFLKTLPKGGGQDGQTKGKEGKRRPRRRRN